MDRSFRGLATIGAVKHFTGGLTLPFFSCLALRLFSTFYLYCRSS